MSEAGRVAIVRTLVAAGARVNRAGTDRVPPIRRARRNGFTETAAALVAAGAR